MYRILPFNGLWNNRDVSEVTNGIMNGKINATGTMTVYQGTNVLVDERISSESVILFSARSNSEFGLPFIESKSKGESKVGYVGDNGTKFDYVVLG